MCRINQSEEFILTFDQSQAMFTAGLAETVQDVVTLNGVEPGMISGLLDYAYTGQITITKHNVQSMLR